MIYYAIKYLPLVIVNLVCNTAPMITAFLSYLILKEQFTKMDIVALLVCFAGVILLITGADLESEQGLSESGG